MNGILKKNQRKGRNMDIEGMEESSESEEQVNPLMQIALGMQRLKKMLKEIENRIQNVEVYLGDMAEASDDEDSLLEFLQDTSKKAQAMSAKVAEVAKVGDGSNGETAKEEDKPADKADGKDSADINTML